MTHAYQEIYLTKAQATMGDVFDYVVNDFKIPGDDFIKLFIASSFSRRMEKGEPSLVMGKSGIEIVLEIMLETTGNSLDVNPIEKYNRSREYWIGWAVAYYQWYSTRSYYEIFQVISFDEFQNMYCPLHEADVSKFVDIVDKRIREHFKDTNLKRIRSFFGYTQADLARESGVTLRSIQMYEQRQKDINKASVQTLYNLAKTLGCTIEDLMEK